MSENYDPFGLTQKEKQNELILLTLAVISFIVIGMGIYYQNRNIDHDDILTPLLFGIYGFFFLILGQNGIKGGNLTAKWYSFLIPGLSKKDEHPDEVDTRKKRLVKIIGKVSLVMAVIMFVFCIVTVIRS
ncbi:MAG: hypothetical protein J5I50_02020 [Chitinophagaceae bacterium]|nr:hypothetical protein [Chitinophagaceae bacterium]